MRKRKSFVCGYVREKVKPFDFAFTDRKKERERNIKHQQHLHRECLIESVLVWCVPAQ